ncbi:minor tail protein [Mycobacterium phage Dori]|uniref:minor tail protein n=1 Tax=Mycobacterium phage Dori TaxID=1089121 RepID=UPI000232F49E|nr:minor tail protein [Mycobacterium phage Dori]AER47677.1 hypothetical protein DORI_26 [Mycobacterium phage Dori]
MSVIISDEQIVSVRTYSGTQLYQFLTNSFTQLKWTRAQREVSLCDLVVPPQAGYVGIPDLTPWLHWIDVWDGDGRERYWSGPIRRVEQGRTWLSVSADDMGTLAASTRCKLTKRWDSADPAEVASELWRTVIEHHGLNVRSLDRVDPRGDRFEFACVADEKMTDEVISELVDLGLYWTVVGGGLRLGPEPFAPIAALGEHDFLDGDLTVIRDGSNTFNDVLLRAGDSVSRARVEMGGLNRETIIHRDSMFGVSNADRAVQQAARYLGAIRDAISVPRGSVLSPDAPLVISDLVPSVRINVEAYGLLSTMELEGVTVECTAGRSTVAVDLESVNDDLPELVEAPRRGPQ